MRTSLVTLKNRDTQVSNTAVYRLDMPTTGGISALDIGVRLQNGSTSAVNLDLLDVVKKIIIQFNGSDARFSMTGQELYRYNWMKQGANMPINFDQSASATQEVWFRVPFGRYIGDQLYGLNLRNYNNVQLQIDYDATVWGAVGATTFTTGTFAPTVLAHQFPAKAVPAFRGMLCARDIYNQTTVASGDIDQKLPTEHPIAGIAVYAMEDNVAEATDITDIVIGRDNYSERWVDGKYYNLQINCNQWIHERSEEYKLYATTADSLDTHLANIRRASCEGVVTALVSGTTDGVTNSVHATAWTGNRLTIGGETSTTTNGTLTTQTCANLSAKAAWMQVEGDIHGMLYFPFARWEDMTDLLTMPDLSGAAVKATQGGAGAYFGIVVEELYN